MARAEDVEVAQAGGIESIAGAVGAKERLAGDLGGGVGAAGEDGHGLDPGDRVVAVGAGAGGEHHPGRACLPGGFQHIEGAGGVDFMIEPGLLNAARDRTQGGLMEDIFAAVCCGGEGWAVEDGGFDDFNVGEFVDIPTAATAHVIEHDHKSAELDEHFGQMRTDETRPAGHEDARILQAIAV